jgi:hypothetical protein
MPRRNHRPYTVARKCQLVLVTPRPREQNHWFDGTNVVGNDKQRYLRFAEYVAHFTATESARNWPRIKIAHPNAEEGRGGEGLSAPDRPELLPSRKKSFT